MSETTPWEEGTGNEPIAILAEAPARVEMSAGRPLVGPAGQLFSTCCEKASIPRRDCYLINLFPFMVHKDRSNALYSPEGECLWAKGKLTERGWEEADGQLQKLRACQARVVCPLGGTALSALHSSSAITKWRGSILWSDEIRKKIVPTIHPAGSLKGQYIWRYMIISDLKRTRQESKSSEIDLPKRQLIIAPSMDEVFASIQTCKANRICNLDIEILGDQIDCISLSDDPSRAICIPFLYDRGNYWTPQQEATIWEALSKEIFENEEVILVNQNLAFDLAVIFQRYNISFKGPLNDPMVAYSIMYPDFPKGLDFLCSILTREPYYKDERKLGSNFRGAFEKRWRYNCKDSAISLECWLALEDEMDDEYRQMHDFTTAMYPALVYMMSRGIAVDIEKLAKMKERIDLEISEKEAELEGVADYVFNPISPKQCVEYFYKHKGIRPYLSRKTGKPTTDDIAMARIVRRHNLPEARLVQEIRNLRKLRSTYLDVEFDKDARLRSSYNPRGTRFSRLSSGETVFGTGLNMQNLDPRFKEFLVAR